MSIAKIHLQNFTVFEELEMTFSPGINVFIGENGTGKTHILKLLYSACQGAKAKKTGIDFSRKIINVFRPDAFNVGHLVSRNAGASIAGVKICSKGGSSITVQLTDSMTRNKFPDAVTDAWERDFKDLACTFIPAKEILSNSANLIQAITAGNVDFDDTYKDIIAAASTNITKGPDSDRKKRYLKTLQGLTSGKVKIKDEKFYLKPVGSQSELEFQLLAEGLRKFALLWQLIKNGALEKGSILFWDEPEANINPKNISAIARLLLDLEEDGVQIFVASHDYFFCKYIDVLKTKKNRVAYHALHKQDNTVRHESADDFQFLINNSIISESIRLYEKEVMKVME